MKSRYGKDGMGFQESIPLLKNQLEKPLPGVSQQYKMAPEFRGKPVFSGKPRNAAVMICLFPGEDDLQLVLIKRPDYEGPHGGQVSFPGGVSEDSDADLIETAIRETREEIGVVCDRTSVVGALTPLMIPVSGMNVHPFVACFDHKPGFITDTREVDYLIITELSLLINPATIAREKWNLHGMEMLVPYYNVSGNVIWGATAMILSEFLEIISRSGLYPQTQYSGNDHNGT